jgi:hypothetical protein
MEEIITKEIAQNLMKIKGEARGTHFVNDAQYILEKKAAKGLKKVEQELERLGCPIKYKEIKNTDFYPIGMRAISLLAIKKTFNWEDEEIKNLCGFATRVSMIIRLYLKFFYSIEKMMEVAPKMWKDYFTVGSLKIVEHDKQGKRVVLRVEDFTLHSIYCRCLEGFFGNIVKMVLGAKSVNCKETKCSISEDCHEFIVTW